MNDRVCRETNTPPVGKEKNQGTLPRCLFLEVESLNKEQENREQIIVRLKDQAKDGKISCTVARRVAEEMKVSPREIGPLCDELKIKIMGCELGCF